ncbi:MAG TPA: hypothetical protein VKY37_08800, partial [Brumimicrobium sp.]|nr:hypothetical protein [Brumimicrobium sp.]
MTEKEKHKILKKVKKYKNQLEELIKSHINGSDENLKPVNVKIEVAFCKNGIIISTKINKHDSGVILPYETNDTTQNVEKQLKFPINDTFIADSRDIKIAKTYNRKTIKDYNGKNLAEKHFKAILENNYLKNDQKIRSLEDALYYADIKDHPKGEFIFRGQI